MPAVPPTLNEFKGQLDNVVTKKIEDREDDKVVEGGLLANKAPTQSELKDPVKIVVGSSKITNHLLDACIDDDDDFLLPKKKVIKVRYLRTF